MRSPLVYSLLLHLAVAVGLTVGAPDFGDPMPAEQPVPVSVVSEEELAKQLGETPPEPTENEQKRAEPEKPEKQEPDPPEQPEEPAPEPPQEQADTSSAPAVPESAQQPDPEPAPEPEPKQQAAVQPPETPEPAPEPDPEPEPAPPTPQQRPEKPEPEQAEKPEPEPEPEPEPAEEAPAQQEQQPEPTQPPEKPRVEMAEKTEEPQERNLDSILKDVEKSLGGESQPDQAEADTRESEETREPQEQATAEKRSDRVTASQRQAIRREIEGCWNVPAGARDAEDLVVKLRVIFNPDRSVGSIEIQNDERMDNSFFSAAARSAARAVHICSPLESLPPDAYRTWRVMELTFDPKEMLDS